MVLSQFPDPFFRSVAEERASWARELYSDDHDVYRLTWTGSLRGPCEEEFATLDDRPDGTPCTITPFINLNPDQDRPSALYTFYQNLTYTSPEEGEAPPKASLALSWNAEFIAPGVQWRMTINAAGIQHDVWLVNYVQYKRDINITPLIEIEVTMLRPASFWQLNVRPTGSYTLEEHKINRMQLPSLLLIGLIYDVLPDGIGCGTTTIQYTTKPAELLSDVIGGIVPDAEVPIPGDEQRIISPLGGFFGCGEYSYSSFFQFCLHREPPIPSLGPDGPPLEIWSSSGSRNRSESTLEATNPNQEPAHGQVAKVRESVQAGGRSGPFVRDEAIANVLNTQRQAAQTRFKSGSDLADSALAIMALLEADPSNPNLLALYRDFLRPNLDQIERTGDTEIEFNPLIHCPIDAVDGVAPILGEHFFEFPIETCAFCPYHDRIAANPYRSWSHSQLLYIDWIWDKLDDSATGNLYERAFYFMQAILNGDAGSNETVLLEEAAQRQRANQNYQIPETRLGDVESAPSPTTQNSVQAQTSTPAFFQDYDPCKNPANTIQYRFLYGSLSSLNPLNFNPPCSRLYGVGR